MSQEYIEIRGARENNLKDVSLSIPETTVRSADAPKVLEYATGVPLIPSKGRL